MAESSTPCVLVHGAWHNARCWQPFLPYLTARGLAPVAPDLPGHGGNPAPHGEVTMARYAEAVAATLDTLDTLDAPAILVGHSMSGAVISQAAELRPGKVRYLVYICAFLLPGGASLAQYMKEDVDSVAAKFVGRTEDRHSLTLAEEGLRSAIYDGVPKAVTDGALKHAQTQPLAPFMAPLHLTPECYGRVPRAYVACTQDKAITYGLQQRMMADLPCDPVLTLDCGHFPQMLAPDRVADFIAGLV